MDSGKAAGLVLVAAAAAGPSYLVERITEYYFLNGPSDVYFILSSERTSIFLVLVLAAGLASGYHRKEIRWTTAAFAAGVVVLVGLLYSLCSPKLCYSTGVDGLEPLRVGFFLACLGIAAAATARSIRSHEEISRSSLFLVCGATIGAIAYYPVVFTMAGTKVLGPLSPWPTLLVVFLPTIAFAYRIAQAKGRWLGFTVPLVADLLVVLITLGVASQYLAMVLPVVYSIVGIAALGAGIGCLASDRPRLRMLRSTGLLRAAVGIVLLSMVVFVPSAVAGVAPQNPSAGAASVIDYGPSVYAGGFATQSFVRLQGVSVEVSFAGTSVAAIQTGNYLSGGLGIHAADCCTDGIDYGYRFDVYLFHDGSEALVASAWKDCDWIMACGGHSWQDLLFLQKEAFNAPLASSIHLFLEWKGRSVYWSDAIGGAPASNFTQFAPPIRENSYFTVGTLGGIPSAPVPPQVLDTDSFFGTGVASSPQGVYFFQYGLMSGFPIGRSGWSLTFACPSSLNGSTWTCIDHSDSIEGDQSFWKAIWRWGNPYPGVTAVSDSSVPSVTFSYSPTTMPSFRSLW